jgi:hypothetical protein
MAAAVILLNLGVKRRLYLFDTFAGMTTRTAIDRDFTARCVIQDLEAGLLDFGFANVPLAKPKEFKTNLRSTGLTKIRSPLSRA